MYEWNMQMNLSTNQRVQNVLVKQYQTINRRVQPTHTRVYPKERTREPSGTDSPGTGTGASHVAQSRQGSNSVPAGCNYYVYPRCLGDLFVLNKIDKYNLKKKKKKL